MKFIDKILSWFKTPELPSTGMSCTSLIAKPRKVHPILEKYKYRPCPERERFNESLHSAGFVAKDGILRVFYNESHFVVELEVNGLTIDLREAKPYLIHPKWKLSDDLVRAWVREHGCELQDRGWGWANNVWF